MKDKQIETKNASIRRYLKQNVPNYILSEPSSSNKSAEIPETLHVLWLNRFVTVIERRQTECLRNFALAVALKTYHIHPGKLSSCHRHLDMTCGLLASFNLWNTYTALDIKTSLRMEKNGIKAEVIIHNATTNVRGAFIYFF